jgi:hypothetical protein
MMYALLFVMTCLLTVTGTAIQIFSLTQRYIYLALATCLGPFLDNHQAII